MTVISPAEDIKDKLATLSVFPVLEGTCIRLRGIRENDVDNVYKLFTDPDVMRYWSRGPMANRQEAVDYAQNILQGFVRRDLLSWIIADSHSDAMIGTATLYEINSQHARAGLGYALMPAFWGKGLAKESATLALCYGFLELGLHRIEADTEPKNTRSNHLLESLGFQREGLLRERFRHPDGIQDSLIFGILKTEWLVYLQTQGYTFESD